MGKHQCEFCLQYFVRPYTLKRHQDLFCSMASKKNTENQTDIDSDTKHESEDDVSDDSSDCDVSDDEGDNDEHEEETNPKETDDDEDDDDDSDLFWDKAVNSVYEHKRDEFQTTVAKMGKKHPNKSYDDTEKEAFEKMKSEYNKDLRKYYLQFLQEMHSLKKSRIHRDVIETAKRLRDMEDYDYDEALQYAVKKRKYLISKKLDEYQHPQLESVDEK